MERATGIRGGRLLLLGGLILAGVALALWQPLTLDELMALGYDLHGHPLALLAMILPQAALLALALPGTLMLWVVAPFHEPWFASLLLTAGSTLGALAAWWLGQWLGRGWSPGPRSQPVVDLLSRRGDFFTQLLLRLLPGFPHSVINYTAGIIGLPPIPFLLAAAIGLSIKWYIYASAIHALLNYHTTPDAGAVWRDALLPLLLLATLLLAGGSLRWYLTRRHSAR